jgi:hypothetical protein
MLNYVKIIYFFIVAVPTAAIVYTIAHLLYLLKKIK